MTLDCCLPAVGTQPGEIGTHTLGAGQDDQVGGRNGLSGTDETKIDLRVQTQRIEVGVVADARQHRHHHFQHFGGIGRLAHIDGILGFQVEIHQVRQHAQHRLAGTSLKPVQPRLQQCDIAAKAVDDEAPHPRLLRRAEQLQRADQMSEDTTLVDIGDEDHRAAHRLGKAHVGDVIGAQVDLGRRARAFHHHHLVTLAQAPMGFQYRLHGHALVIVIGGGIHLSDGPPMNDHLGAGVAVGLEQHRVHVGMRWQPGGLGLHRLGAADLAAVGGYRAVERHVLRLERRHRHALARQPAAQRGHQGALAGVGGGALHHQRGHPFCSR